MSQIRSFVGDYLQQKIQDRKFKNSVRVYVNTLADAEALEHLVGATFKAVLSLQPRPHARSAGLRTLALTQLYGSPQQPGDKVLVLAPGPGEWPYIRDMIARGAKVDVAYPPPDNPQHAENVQRMQAFVDAASKPQEAFEDPNEEPDEVEPSGMIYFDCCSGSLRNARDPEAMKLHVARAEQMNRCLYTHIYGSFVADGLDVEALAWQQPRAYIRLVCHRPECYNVHVYRLENDHTIFFEDRVYDYEDEHLRVTFLSDDQAVRFTTHNGQAQEPAQWYDVSMARMRQRFLPKIGNLLCKYEPVGRSTVGVWTLIPCAPCPSRETIVHTHYYALPDLRVRDAPRNIIVPKQAYFEWCADVANMSSVNPGSCAQLLRGRMSQIGDRRNMQEVGCHTWQLHKKDYAILAAWIYMETVHGAKTAAETIANAKDRFLRRPRASVNNYLRDVASFFSLGGIRSNEARDAAARLMRESHLNGCGPRPVTLAYATAESRRCRTLAYTQKGTLAPPPDDNTPLGPQHCTGVWFIVDPPPHDKHCFSTCLSYVTGVRVPPIAPTVAQAQAIISNLHRVGVLEEGLRELRIIDGEQPHAIGRVRVLDVKKYALLGTQVTLTAICHAITCAYKPTPPARGKKKRPAPPPKRRNDGNYRRFEQKFGPSDPRRAQRQRSVSPPLLRREPTRREKNSAVFAALPALPRLKRTNSAPMRAVAAQKPRPPKRTLPPQVKPVLRRAGSLDRPSPRVRGQRRNSCPAVERFKYVDTAVVVPLWHILETQEDLAVFAAGAVDTMQTGKIALAELVKRGRAWCAADARAATSNAGESSFHAHLLTRFAEQEVAENVPIPDLLWAPPAAAKSAVFRGRGHLVVVPTNELREEWMNAESNQGRTSVVRTWDKVFLTTRPARSKVAEIDTVVFDEFVVFTPERVAYTVAFLIAAGVVRSDCRVVLLGDTNQGGVYAPGKEPTAWRDVVARRYFYPHTFGMCEHVWKYFSKITGASYPAAITAHGECGLRVDVRRVEDWPTRAPAESKDTIFRTVLIDKDIEARGAAISAQGSRWSMCRNLHLFAPKIDKQRGRNDAYTHVWTLLTRCVYTAKHRVNLYGPWPAFRGCRPLVRGRDEAWPLPPVSNVIVPDVNTAIITSAIDDDGRMRATVHQTKVTDGDAVKERKVVEVQHTQVTLGNEFLKRGEVAMIRVRAADANRLPVGAHFGVGNELLRLDWELWRSLQSRNPYSHFVGEDIDAPSSITNQILRDLVQQARTHRGWTLSVDQLTQREMRPARVFLGNESFFESAAAHSASDAQRTAVCMLKRLIAPNYNSLMRLGKVPKDMCFDIRQQIHIGRFVYEQMARRSRPARKLEIGHVAILVATVIDLRTAAKSTQTLDRSYFDGIIRNLEDHNEERVNSTLFELDVENAGDTRKAMIVKTQLKLVENIQSLYGKAGQPVLSADRAYTYLQRNLRTLCKVLPVLVANRFPAGGGFEVMQAATFGYGAPAAVDEWDARASGDLFHSVDVESCDTTYTGVPIGFVSALYGDPANWADAPTGLGERIERYLRATLGIDAPVKVVVISVGGRYQIRAQLASGDLITLDLNTISTICNWVQSHCFQWRNCETEGFVNIGHGVWVRDLQVFANVMRTIDTGDDANIEVSSPVAMVAENKVFISFKEKLIDWTKEPLDFCHQLRFKDKGRVWRTHDFMRTFAKITARKFSSHAPTAKTQIKEIVTAVRDLCEGCQCDEAVGMAASILAKFYHTSCSYTENVIRQVIAYSRCSHVWLFDQCYTAPVRSFVEAEHNSVL